MKEILITAAIAIILFFCFYFFIHNPSLQSEYKKGVADCSKNPEYVYGDTVTVYRDTTHTLSAVSKIKKVPHADSTSQPNFWTVATFDTSLTSYGDNIRIVESNLIKGDSLLRYFDIQHVHKETFRVDTLKIPYPVEIVVKEIDWLISGITFVLGIITTFIIAVSL